MAERNLKDAIVMKMRQCGMDESEIAAIIENAKNAGKEPSNKEAGDSFDENGVLICGICGHPKEGIIYGDNGAVRYPIVHDHDIELMNAASSTAMRKESCFKGYEDYANATFDICDSPLRSIFESYCAQFREYGKIKGAGFIVYGERGTGKTFLSACVCNRLIELGYRCRFTSIRNALDNKQATMLEIEKMDFVVLDDYGTERTTSYGIETAYDIINRIYSKRIPVIVTTNMRRSQLMDPPREVARAVDRLKERCQAIAYEGPNRRQEAIL